MFSPTRLTQIILLVPLCLNTNNGSEIASYLAMTDQQTNYQCLASVGPTKMRASVGLER